MTDYPTESLAAHPPYLFPDYVATRLRAPSRPLVIIPQTLTEIAGPVFGQAHVRPGDSDLTRQHAGTPLGERIMVRGRVLDENSRPVPDTLIEIWQANAAGRYVHVVDRHDAPLDPNFTGAGRAVTDSDGWYEFVTIRPGCYPVPGLNNVWRPAHIHMSLFGPSFLTRLVTQMYFPGDPLFPYDPIFMSVPDERARMRMVSSLDMAMTRSEWALCYRFDIVLRGREASLFEEPHHD
ncbi:protocatechuate 3,4-dioxygenase subunit beta [Propylenella binzhouense]|uniref:Protocatechuate 3,4-dioxygenase subunit beta n=1 Tax=Propylenella binzhouense TaxID=2555902 RepID=A0A964T7I5_9HYPH|nr:protocatechuate 3,4-dioxygenase subunit beta [Propylenella binzhouense]